MFRVPGLFAVFIFSVSCSPGGSTTQETPASSLTPSTNEEGEDSPKTPLTNAKPAAIPSARFPEGSIWARYVSQVEQLALLERFDFLELDYETEEGRFDRTAIDRTLRELSPFFESVHETSRLSPESGGVDWSDGKLPTSFTQELIWAMRFRSRVFVQRSEIHLAFEEAACLRRIAEQFPLKQYSVAFSRLRLYRTAIEIERNALRSSSLEPEIAQPMAKRYSTLPRPQFDYSALIQGSSRNLLSEFAAELKPILVQHFADEGVTEASLLDQHVKRVLPIVRDGMTRNLKGYYARVIRGVSGRRSLQERLAAIDAARSEFGAPSPDAFELEAEFRKIMADLPLLPGGVLSEEDLEAASPLYEYIGSTLVSIMAEADPLLVRLFARCQAEDQLVRLSLHLWAYYSKHEEWPDQLSDIPEISADLLIDPADGASIRYRKTNAGCEVYSVAIPVELEDEDHRENWRIELP